MLRRTENSFFAEAVDTERYNRFATVWPHSDFTVVYPERLPFIKEAIMNYDGIPADAQEELQRAAKSASRWAFVQVSLRAISPSLGTPLAQDIVLFWSEVPGLFV